MSTSRSMMITVAFAIAVVLYWVSLAIYRLYLSPLAKVPGPTLAALTQWTETYYEILHGHGGQFLFQYRKWHEQYGSEISFRSRSKALLTVTRSHRSDQS